MANTNITIATGRRKTSVARVRMFPGKGEVTVNNKKLDEYFGKDLLIAEAARPFKIASAEGKFNIKATIKGGGESGQSGALRHGIARALAKFNEEEYRQPLKAAGFLTRDSRMVERKKYGLKKARRAPQFSKR